jgi:hypothetical protein
MCELEYILDLKKKLDNVCGNDTMKSAGGNISQKIVILCF